MKSLSAACLSVVLALLFTRCSSDSPSSINYEESQIVSGVYLFDDGDQYRYIQVPSSMTTAIRSSVSKDAGFNQLVQDKRCFLKPENVQWKAGRERWIRVHKENVFLEVASRGADGQLFLSYDETDMPDYEDSNAVFYIHEFGKVDGKLAVSIESMRYPGHYLANVGNTLSANGITLLPFTSKEAAPRILIHQMSTVINIGK